MTCSLISICLAARKVFCADTGVHWRSVDAHLPVNASVGTWHVITPVMGTGNENLATTPLFSRLPKLPVTAIVTLALLAAVLLPANPASAQSGATPCAAGDAVADAANNPGLLADCDALLAARDTLAGSADT